MLSLQEMRTNTLNFFRLKIWYLNDRDAVGWKAYLLKSLRVIVLTVQGFLGDKSPFQASALTFYSLLAIIPILAMLFGLAQGFGLDQQLEKILWRFLGQEETVADIVVYARNLLKNTRGGVIAGVGVVLLFWSAFKVLGRIESTFNQIWKVTSRSLIRKFTDYLAILILGPFFILISSSINIYITAHFSDITREFALLRLASPLVLFLFQLLPYGLIWLLFILLYLVIPNTRVRFLSALVGGVVAGAVFQLLQGGYIYTQLVLSRYNAIYGSLAAPFFLLIWMQLSWMIVLLGARMAYAHQNVGHHAVAVDYERISPHLRKKYALYVFWALVRGFKAGTPAMTPSDLAGELELHHGLIMRILQHLLFCRLISAVISDTPDGVGYQPAMDVHGVTLAYVLETMERSGVDDLPEKSNPEFVRIFEAIDALTKDFHHLSTNRVVHEI